jgi:alanyl-tRNA synthetase
MNANELREKYQSFFEARDHRRIPSASLCPENDPTVLFTTAGMHPLVPFLLGEPHPQGRRLTNFQKCLRTNDIDEVGDASHLTFFEMLGNWSLGDYFKSESLAWSYAFLVEELHVDSTRLGVTVFAGDQDAPPDSLSAEIWRGLGIPAERIFFLPKADNWWGPVGQSGPCGPDSEIFFDTGLADHPGCHPGCACGKWLEVWNNVFMAYEKTEDGRYLPLQQPNVDTGMGVERMLAALSILDRGGSGGDVFMVDTLYPLIEAIERMSGKAYSQHVRPFRVIADHLRGAALAIADGALPSNVEAGYVVRRLIRRAVLYGRELGIQGSFCARFGEQVVALLGPVYPELLQRQSQILSAMDEEEGKFKRTLKQGLHWVEKTVRRLRESGLSEISGKEAFDLYETYGFPLPLTVELAGEYGMQVEEKGFARAYEAHQALSRQNAEMKFKGGLADQSRATTRLHTASHLLQQALRMVLGPEVHQMGSNITPERLRFDFSCPDRLTDGQLAEVERLVNGAIQADLPVSMAVMPLNEAVAGGALAFFGEKYGDQVKVYAIGEYSKEVCGGPHVLHTGELGHFRIIKQEAVGQGVRRIRAVLA